MSGEEKVFHIGQTVKINKSLDHPSTTVKGDKARIIMPDASGPSYLIRFEKNNEQRWINADLLEPT